MNATDLKQIKNIILDSLKNFRNELKKDFATKDDLKSLEENIDKKLEVLRKEIKEDIGEAFSDVFQSADKNKAKKSDFQRLEKRVDKIEKTLQIH